MNFSTLQSVRTRLKNQAAMYEKSYRIVKEENRDYKFKLIAGLISRGYYEETRILNDRELSYYKKKLMILKNHIKEVKSEMRKCVESGNVN